MKKLIFTIALALFTSLFFAQTQISPVRIKSKTALIYDSRKQISDTIYTAINEWSYVPKSSIYTATSIDYVKQNGEFVEIDQKVSQFTSAQVDGLFVLLQNPILLTESYTSELNVLLTKALLHQIKTDLNDNGKTIYGGNAVDWQIDN